MKKKGAQLRRALSVVELVQAETGDQGFRGAKSVPIVRLMPEILEARRLGYSRAVIWRVLTNVVECLSIFGGNIIIFF